MSDTIVLKNGLEVALESGGSLSDLKAVFPDRESMLTTWEEFTPDNLKAVEIQNSDGVTVGTYSDLVLVSEISMIDPIGVVRTSFHLREKSEIEKRLEALENGLITHSGAINDLGAITSALAEAQEGGTK